MSIVRMIYVKVEAGHAAGARSAWKQHCAPLMIQQSGCLSEKLLECTDAEGEFISYSEWEDQPSIDRYRDSDAHADIVNHTSSLRGDKPVVKRYREV